MRRTSESIGDDWATFFLRNRASLTAYAISLTGNGADAQDIIQEILTRMVRQRRPVEDARAYVMRCLRNLTIDRRRSDAARPACETLDRDNVAFMDSAAVADDEEAGQLRDAIAALPDDRREIIVLKVYGELTFREIAETVDRPLGTVTSAYARGLDELREALSKEVDHAS